MARVLHHRAITGLVALGLLCALTFEVWAQRRQHVEASVYLAASPSTVDKMLTNPNELRSWAPWLSSDPGTKATLLAHDPMSRVELRLDLPNARTLHSVWSLEALPNGGTRLRCGVDEDTSLTSTVMRVVRADTNTRLAAEVAGWAGGLKATIEALGGCCSLISTTPGDCSCRRQAPSP